MERIIRLWHVLRKVHADAGEEFTLDNDNNKNDILQLFSLLLPLCAITGDGQYVAVLMVAEMHLAFGLLKTETLDPDQPLRVFDIPLAPGSAAALQAEEECKRTKPPLPHKMVPATDLRPVATRTRKELSKALVQRLFGRVWDEDTSEASLFHMDSVLLSPPFNTGKVLEALRLTVEDAEFLPASKKRLALTTEEWVAAKFPGSWDDITSRASKAALEEHNRLKWPGKDGNPPAKRPRMGGLSSTATTSSRFASFGRGLSASASAQPDPDASEASKMRELVRAEVERCKSLFVTPEEIDCREVLTPKGVLLSRAGRTATVWEPGGLRAS